MCKYRTCCNAFSLFSKSLIVDLLDDEMILVFVKNCPRFELLHNFRINANSEGHFFNLPMSPAFFPSFWLLPAADGCASPPPLPQCTGAQVGVKHEHVYERSSPAVTFTHCCGRQTPQSGNFLTATKTTLTLRKNIRATCESHFEIVFELKIKVLFKFVSSISYFWLRFNPSKLYLFRISFLNV